MDNFIVSNKKDGHDGYSYEINFVDFEYVDDFGGTGKISDSFIIYADKLIKKYPGIQMINMCKNIVRFYIECGGDKKNINIKLTKV